MSTLNPTLADLILLASKHGPTRYPVEMAKLASVIADGTLSNQNLILPQTEQQTVASVQQRVELQDSPMLLLAGSEFGGGGRTLISLEAGTPGQLLLVMNVGDRDITFNSNPGETDPPLDGEGFYRMGRQTNVATGVVSSVDSDVAVLTPGNCVLLVYSAFWAGWSAVVPLPVDGTSV